MMILTRGRATQSLEAKDYAVAIAQIEEGIENISEFYREYSRGEASEQSGELVFAANLARGNPRQSPAVAPGKTGAGIERRRAARGLRKSRESPRRAQKFKVGKTKRISQRVSR